MRMITPALPNWNASWVMISGVIAARHERPGDHAEALPAIGAVEVGDLVQLSRDRLERGPGRRS